MGWYDQERKLLKGFVAPALKAGAISRGHPDSPELDAMLDSRLEERLVAFERAAIAHHRWSTFWAGVLQGIVATVVYTALLYLGAWMLAAHQIDVFSPLRPSASPTPSPTPPPLTDH